MDLQTVFVVDDDQDIRDSLTLLLNVNDYRVRTFSSAESFLESHIQNQIGCLLLDVRLKGIDGFELQKELNQSRFNIPIIFITGHGDVAMAVKAMQSGAVDFVEKPFSKSTLLEKINTALQLSHQTYANFILGQDAIKRYERLSNREKEVMMHMISPQGGSATKSIASKLDISTRTAEKHRAQVLKKMQVKSLPELIDVSQHCQLSFEITDNS